MKHRLVPLVIYRNGLRETIGTAKVDDSGVMECTIHDMSLTGKLMEGLGEMSISVMPDIKLNESNITHCWACALGKCGQLDDPTCDCCKTNHE